MELADDRYRHKIVAKRGAAFTIMVRKADVVSVKDSINNL